MAMDSAEIIWNLKRLIRDGYPQGMPLKYFQQEYFRYFQDHLPNPSSIVPGCEHWYQIFTKSEQFQKWFRLDKKNIITVRPIPEGDLKAYFRLVRYKNYLCARVGAKADGLSDLSESEDDDDTTDGMQMIKKLQAETTKSSAALNKSVGACTQEVKATSESSSSLRVENFDGPSEAKGEGGDCNVSGSVPLLLCLSDTDTDTAEDESSEELSDLRTDRTDTAEDDESSLFGLSPKFTKADGACHSAVTQSSESPKTKKSKLDRGKTANQDHAQSSNSDDGNLNDAPSARTRLQLNSQRCPKSQTTDTTEMLDMLDKLSTTVTPITKNLSGSGSKRQIAAGHSNSGSQADDSELSKSKEVVQKRLQNLCQPSKCKICCVQFHSDSDSEAAKRIAHYDSSAHKRALQIWVDKNAAGIMGAGELMWKDIRRYGVKDMELALQEQWQKSCKTLLDQARTSRETNGASYATILNLNTQFMAIQQNLIRGYYISPTEFALALRQAWNACDTKDLEMRRVREISQLFYERLNQIIKNYEFAIAPGPGPHP